MVGVHYPEGGLATPSPKCLNRPGASAAPPAPGSASKLPRRASPQLLLGSLDCEDAKTWRTKPIACALYRNIAPPRAKA
jgi:hypothetical protein